MSNITTCVDSTRQLSPEDEKLLEEKFAAIEQARAHLYDVEAGRFRTMAEAMELARSDD